MPHARIDLDHRLNSGGNGGTLLLEDLKSHTFRSMRARAAVGSGSGDGSGGEKEQTKRVKRTECGGEEARE